MAILTVGDGVRCVRFVSPVDAVAALARRLLFCGDGVVNDDSDDAGRYRTYRMQSVQSPRLARPSLRASRAAPQATPANPPIHMSQTMPHTRRYTSSERVEHGRTLLASSRH